MLHIINHDGSTSVHSLPFPAFTEQQVINCRMMDADGDEADAIFIRFGGSTYHNNNPTSPWCVGRYPRQQTWYGDIARTILANL